MLETEFLGNSVREYLVAGGSFLAVLLALVLLRRLVLDRLSRWLQSGRAGGHELLVTLLDQVRIPEWLVLAFYLATRSLDLSLRLDRLLYATLVVVLTYRAMRILQDLTAYTVRRAVLPEGMAGAAHHDTARNITFAGQALLWAAGLLFALGTLGINVRGVLAGLGIGGVAVALAAQAVLGDLFSAIAIFLDKPFVVGDPIVVDNFQGTVEHIGLKTTRVRALSGEMLVFPNSYLTSAKIRNFQNLQARRGLFTFGVSRQTPPEKLKKVAEIAKGAISRAGHARFDRAHLKDIADSSFDFEVVYHVLDSDYNRYMDVHESVLLGLLEGLKKESISLAYPIQALVKESRLPLA